MNKPNRRKVPPPKQQKRERTPDAGETTVPATGDAEAERRQQLAFARFVHGPVSGGITYAAISKHLQPCSAFAETAQQFTADFIQRVAPRDPLEELLAIQMLYSHARVGYLSTQATQQRDPKKVKVFHEAADGASNTYRKLMLGLAQYRRPPRGGDTFMAIRQANVAEQQVVQNQSEALPRGLTHANERKSIEHVQSPEAPLPAVARGPSVAQEVGGGQPAMGEQHGTAHRDGEGPVENERLPARGQVRRGRRKA